jgi:hypothetical protein
MRDRLIVWLRWQLGGRERQEDAARAAERARDVTARFVAAGGTIVATVSATVVAAFDPEETEDVLDLLLDLLAEQAVPGSAARVPRESELPAAAGGSATFAVCLGPVDLGAQGAASGGGLCAAVGAAIDRAQLLAGRARGGEVVVDAEVRARAAPTFLFERTIGTGRLRGTTLDRRHPRRAPCREAVRALGRLGVAPSHAAVFAELRRRVAALVGEAAGTASPAGGVVVLRGPPGAGARVLAARLAEQHAGHLLLEFPAVVGGLEPLGSLAGGLRGAAARLGSLALPAEAAATLAALAEGRAQRPEGVARAVDALIDAVAAGGGATIFLADPVSLTDGPSLAVAAEAATRGRALLIARAAVEAALPAPLTGRGTEPLERSDESGNGAARSDLVAELVLPPLLTSDALALASGLLGAETSDDVIRRVAVIGGDTPAGVEEAARTLVACGDLVQDGEAWVWRSAERDRQSAAAVEELLAERLAVCEEAPVRVLECLAVVGDRQAPGVVRAVALADGLDPGTFARALATARRDGLVTTDDPPALVPTLLRRTLLDAMPVARLAELHRFAAEARRAEAVDTATAEGDDSARFVDAAIGAHCREGGATAEAASALLAAAHLARDHGWQEAAAMLARAAVETHDHADTRRLAAPWLPAEALAPQASGPRGVDAPAARPRRVDPEGAEATTHSATDPRESAVAAPPEASRASHPIHAVAPGPASPRSTPRPAGVGGAEAEARGGGSAPPSSAGARPRARAAMAALRAGDAASLEALAARARASGRPPEAADRVRAVASLLRGDTASALRILQRDRHADRCVGGAGASTRTALALAVALHESGDLHGAVRAALGALASARRAQDARGDEAALRALARTFASLGRGDAAEALERAAAARASAAGTSSASVASGPPRVPVTRPSELPGLATRGPTAPARDE